MPRPLHLVVLQHPRMLTRPIQAIEPRGFIVESTRTAQVVSIIRSAGGSDNPEGRRVSHEYLSTPEACKGRDAPSSALALHTDPGQATHFPAPRTGRGAALGLCHEAPARIFTIPEPKGHSCLLILSVEHCAKLRRSILAGRRQLQRIVRRRHGVACHATVPALPCWRRRRHTRSGA